MAAVKIFKMTVLLNGPIYSLLLLYRVQFFDSGCIQCSSAL